MSANRLLQHVRSLIRRGGGGSASDGQLLERFVKERDETAFEVLVWRHGPMVLALGQRLLRNVHDAEDVLQATFLTLVRKAGSIGDGESLSSWLYKVAYRIALRSQARAAKMVVDDRLVEAVAAPEAADESVWRELRPLLDAAIQRLPEKYRTAIVLCDLQGKTHREAAEQLGCAVGTISTRVTRAREMLRKRLAHRGLALSLGVLGAALSQRTASAMSGVLTAATVRAATRFVSDGSATGIVSASVAELIEGANQAMLMTRFKIAALLMLAIGGVAVGVGVTARHEGPLPSKEPPPVQAAKTPGEKPKIDAVTVRGRVLDPDGKPIEGARLYWPRLPKTEPRSQEDIEKIEFTERAKTDSEGRFRFELPRSDIPLEGPSVSLVAAADGFGVDGVSLPKNDPAPEVTLRLVKDHPIEGRIINTEGKPLAGVNVWIWVVGKMRQERLDDFLAAWKRKNSRVPDGALGQLSEMMFLSRSLKSSQAVTDKDGRFRIQGAGVERVAMVRFRAPGLKPAPLFVINRAGFDPAAWNKAARDNVLPGNRRPDNPLPLYGPKIEYVTTAGRRIEGTVREAGSGKPVPGYRISTLGDGFGIEAVSDKEGKYKLLGVPKKKEYWLHAHPPANNAWLLTTTIAKDAAGLQTLQVDITVARGIVVVGRILDRSTGKGVPGGVRFVPLPGNKFFGKPGYDYYKYGQQEQTMTDGRDPGRFRLAVLPGPGVLMVQARGQKINGDQTGNLYQQAEFNAKDREQVKLDGSDDRDRVFLTALANHSEYLFNQNAAKVLDLAADAGTTKCDVFVDRGTTRTFQIEDAGGKPLKGTVVGGITATWPDAMAITDATCTIFALDPKKPRRVLVLHPQRRLAATLLLRGDEKAPVIARLKPTEAMIGRLLDAEGKPLAGADVNLYLFEEPSRSLYRIAKQQLTARSDKDGRFRVEGIVPEVKFRLGIVRGRTFFAAQPRIEEKQVKPGETLDLGEVRVKPRP